MDGSQTYLKEKTCNICFSLHGNNLVHPTRKATFRIVLQSGSQMPKYSCIVFYHTINKGLLMPSY